MATRILLRKKTYFDDHLQNVQVRFRPKFITTVLGMNDTNRLDIQPSHGRQSLNLYDQK